MLLGLPIRDRDYLVTDSTVEAFLAAFPQAKAVGKTFPVVILDGQEFSFLRGVSLVDDFAARDFTINAMAIDEHGELLCHANALEDMKNRVLRPSSQHSLNDDPLRVFRAARFLTELPGFVPHESLFSTMATAAAQDSFLHVHAERVGQEVLKACASPRPGDFLRALNKANALHHWFEELRHSDDIPGGPPRFHDASVLEHTARVMDGVANDGGAIDPLCTWMALCHDLGKTTTLPDALPQHIGHDVRGEALATALGLRLRLPTRYVQAGADAARWHLLAGRYESLRMGTRVDLLFRLTSRALLREVFRLANVDSKHDFRALARADFEAASSVRLPAHLVDQGAESGRRLRLLRIEAMRTAHRTT